MPSTNESILPDQDWNRLQEFADRFAEARREGPVDFWDQYLPPESDRLYRPTLVEIVKVDLDMAWRGGRKPTIDSYLPKYPELEPVPVDLIVEEYRIRRAHGDKPEVEEFLSRFPAQFPEFSEKIKKLPSPPATPVTDTQHKATGTVIKEPAPAPSAKQSAPVCPDGYTLIEPLGRGNFAEVWKAEAPGGIELALKIVSEPLDQEAAQREKQSLDLMKKLQHPTLAGVVAYWTINNRLVIGMELADKTLRDRLKECQQEGHAGIPAAELVGYFRDAAQGLDWLHGQGVLHRDIKPENILLKKGYTKVADFGLAKRHLGALATGSFAGTPAFMAPEIWGGKVGKASDQYSLAFTYAELRLGRRPLKGEGFAQVMEATLTGQPDLGDIPAPEADVLRRALAKRPEERFGSCLEFVKALERAGGVASVERGGYDSGPRPAVPVAPAAPAASVPTPPPARLSGSRVPAEKPIAAAPAAQQSIAVPAAMQPSIAAPTPPKPAYATPPPVKNWKDPAPPAQPPKPPAAPQRSWAAPPPRRKPQGGGKGVAIVAIVLLAAGLAGAVVYMKWPAINPNRTTEPSTTAQGPTTPDTTSTPQPTSKPQATSKPSATSKPPPTTSDPDKPVLPGKRFESAPGAQEVSVGGKRVYDKVTIPIAGGLPATFLLMRPDGAEMKPFYILEHKAWNALVQDYLEKNPGKIGADWKGGRDTLPAFNLTFAEAEQVAKGFDGRIPTAAEWDFAAGFTRRTGIPGAPKAIQCDAPLPVNADPGDESPLKVRNMAGNGREFTSDTLQAGGQRMVVLRGRMFTLSRPLTFDDIVAEQKPERTQTQYPTARSPQTGVRIVVDVP